jgi:predicted DNA binding protein
MTLYEMEFRLQHDCPYNDLTRRHPKAVIALWCNWSKHVMEISCDDLDVFQGIQDDLGNIEKLLKTKIIRKAFSGTNAQIILQECGCGLQSKDVGSIIIKHNCLEMVPELYHEGWEFYRIVAFSQKDVRNLFDELEKFATVEIISRKSVEDHSVRETFVISTSSLIGGLTTLQIRALAAALDFGYYRVPKKTTAEEIAKQLGVPRTTYEEHLRKAEGKVLQAVAPYIQLGKSKRQ